MLWSLSRRSGHVRLDTPPHAIRHNRATGDRAKQNVRDSAEIAAAIVDSRSYLSHIPLRVQVGRSMASTNSARPLATGQKVNPSLLPLKNLCKRTTIAALSPCAMRGSHTTTVDVNVFKAFKNWPLGKVGTRNNSRHHVASMTSHSRGP